MRIFPTLAISLSYPQCQEPIIPPFSYSVSVQNICTTTILKNMLEIGLGVRNLSCCCESLSFKARKFVSFCYSGHTWPLLKCLKVMCMCIHDRISGQVPQLKVFLILTTSKADECVLLCSFSELAISVSQFLQNLIADQSFPFTNQLVIRVFLPPHGPRRCMYCFTPSHRTCQKERDKRLSLS